MLQMLISFHGNQWEMFLLVGFTYSIILWAKVMWHRSSPKYLASHICKLNCIWIKLNIWIQLNGNGWPLPAAPHPPTWLLFDQGSQSAPAEVPKWIMVKVSPPGHRSTYTKIHDWHIPWSIRNPCEKLPKPPPQVNFTLLLGLLDVTSRGSGNHGPATRLHWIGAYLRQWQSKIHPPLNPCGEASKKIGPFEISTCWMTKG